MALAFVLAGCFNPPPQTTATGDPDTGEPDTGEPDTTTPTAPTTGVSPTTGDDPTATTTAVTTPPETATDVDPSTTTAASTTAPEDCMFSTDCPDGFCHPDKLVCVECLNDLDCMHPDLPHCDDDSNTCVPCVENSDCASHPDAPICDKASQTCRPCDEHSDCPETACDLAGGACFPPEATTHAYVDEASCNDGLDDPMCGKGQPCCQIADAFTSIVLNQQVHTVIHVAGGLYTNMVGLALDGRKVALLAESGAVLRTEMNQGAAVELGDSSGDKHISSALYVAGLTVTGTLSSGGVACLYDTGSMWFDDGAIGGHAGPGLRARACQLTVRRTLVTGNITGVHADDSGVVLLRNTIVSGVHLDLAAKTTGTGALDVLYSTIADRHLDPGHLLACAPVAPITLRNSIAFTNNSGLLNLPCPLNASHNAFTEGTVVGLDATNTVYPVDSQGTFFVGWDLDDLDLKDGENPLQSIALWLSGDPRTDLHGAPRPNVDMTVDAVGADIPLP